MAALPVLAHLRARHTLAQKEFPNVELARLVSSGRRWFVSDAALLVARSAVVAFVLLAVAGPYWGDTPPRKGGALAEGDVAILFDRSWPDRQSFAEAVEAAGAALQLSEGALFIPFDDVPGPCVTGQRAKEVMEALGPSGRRSDIDAALRVAEGLLRGRGTVVLISPRAAIAPPRKGGARLIAFTPILAHGSGASLIGLELGQGTLRAKIRCGGAEMPESFEARLHLDGAEEPFRVFKLHRGSAELRPLPIGLEICLPLPEMGTPRILTLKLLTGGASVREGFAHSRSVLLPRRRAPRVALLQDGDAAALRRAFEALNAASAESEALLSIELEELSFDALSELGRFDVAVLADSRALGEHLCPTLAAFVRNGGGLVGFGPLEGAGLPREFAAEVVACGGLPEGAEGLDCRLGFGRAVFLTTPLEELKDRPALLLPLVDALLRLALSPPVERAVIDAAGAPRIARFSQLPERPTSVWTVSPSGRRIAIPIGRRRGLVGEPTWAAVVPCDEPGIWKVFAGDRLEHMIAVNASAESLCVFPDPSGGRVLSSRAELISSMKGRGALALSPIFAAGALAAAAGELAIAMRRRFAR